MLDHAFLVVKRECGNYCVESSEWWFHRGERRERGGEDWGYPRSEAIA